ncbi:immunoglobulin superfamily member 10 [Antennarius striatus]|uniref:immunoglobulin superfamily member 10 n=1 Tax=Antennarius striatus TaxID=241820 RepID=UPI0035B228E4
MRKMSACARSAAYLRRWMLKAVLILAAVLPAGGDCPTSCACVDHTEVHCTFRYLTAVPDHIHTAAEKINLGYNSISVLRENNFAGLENLQLLMLHSNTIYSIEDRAFQDLKSLQVLKLSFNKVRKINKKTFTGLNSLLRLHIDHNHIDFISPEAFYGLTNLQLVHLEGNHLQQVHPDTFITLRHSQVFKVSSVTNIHLSDNLLTTLPADIFSGCSQLENLFLHGNPWSCDCRMKWFSSWTQMNSGVLKCKRDRKNTRVQLCPVCQNPAPYHKRQLSLLPSDAFTCTKPWIEPNLKQENISVDEGEFTPVTPKDFIAPLGSMQLNLTNQFHNDASLSCSVQRPSAFENLTQSFEEERGKNVTLLTVSITSYLVCNIDYEHIQQLWQILATYSDSPMRLERDEMLASSPEMVYRYTEMKTDEEEEIYTGVETAIKASPAWLMQGKVHFQLDRTTTTLSTLHIKYQSVVNLRVENASPKKDRYSWTMIRRDNQTKTEHAVLRGGVAQLDCHVQGEPKPLLEWILPDGNKVRAPYYSDDSRIIITAEGRLTLRDADPSDTGIYRCIATNYLDADILIFRVTILSPDVEEFQVNGVQLFKAVGENLFFDCSSSGNPEASVQWILPDHTVLDKSYRNRKVYENGSLLIQGLTERDRGFYRCLVANHLGVDLLVSQVTVTEEKSETTTVWDSDGSVTEMVEKSDHSSYENIITLSESPSSSPSERNSQESRTVTSDLPYSSFRSQGRGAGQNKRGSSSNRRLWSNRVHDKASRRVDPQKFAELMKKAQDGSRGKTERVQEMITYTASSTGLAVGGEFGSGESHDEDQHIIVPAIPKPTTDPQKATVAVKVNRNSKTKLNIEDGLHLNTETTKSHQIIEVETHTLATQPYVQSDSPIKSTFTNNPRQRSESEFDAFKPYHIVPDNTGHSSIDEASGPNGYPVTLQLTVTDSSQETQLQFSGETPGEQEMYNWAALSVTTNPNVTPVKNVPDPVKRGVNKDRESQTTFTAVTTTERQQDEITLRTTQTIKSPHLSAGSTIISRQRIHIIPHKNSRGGGGGGRRKFFQSRRRILKPSRITDIQSFMNKLKQPSVKKEGTATVPYKIEVTTDCNCDEDKRKTTTTDLQVLKPTSSTSQSSHRTEKLASTQKTAISTTNDDNESKPEVSSGYVSSVDAPEFDSMTDPDLTTNGKQSTSTMSTTTTTASKVIHGRIPWNKLYGSIEREKILRRLKRPFITQKTTTTTTTETTTSPLPVTTTVKSQNEPDLLSPSRHTGNKQGSLDDDYGDMSSAGFEFTTVGPSFHYLTTRSSHSRFFTTSETPAKSQTLSAPPTVKPPTNENRNEYIASGSGGLPDNWFVNRDRFNGRGRQGRRWKPIRGRRPYNRPTVTKLFSSTTTEPSTTYGPTEEQTTEVTTLPQSTVSFYKPLYIPSRNTIRVSTDQTSKEEIDFYEEYDWSNLPAYTSPRTPLKSTTTFMPTTTRRSPMTVRSRVHANIQHPTQGSYNTRKPPARWIKPTVPSSVFRGRVNNGLTFDTMTNRAEHDNNIGNGNAMSSYYDEFEDIEATSSSIVGFISTARVITNKPKIVGGNAASFTVLSNSDAYMPCEAIGNPQPTVTWKRFSSSTGNTVTIKGKMGKFEVFSNGTLSIQNANIKDRGQYLCLAENHHGSDKLLVTLSVVAYPSRILEPKVREMKSHAGNTVELKCKAEGRPPPLISWILANRTQVRGLNKEMGRVSVSGDGTLVIEQVSVYDRGHYKCIASNPAGADTSTVRLQVVAAPPGIVEEKRQHVTADERQDLWLPCTGQGSPQPTIHWVLDDGSLVLYNRPAGTTRISMHVNGTLHIKDVTEADSGKYECIATSYTGSERRVVTLTVESKDTAPQILEASQHLTELFFGDQLRLNCSATGDPEPKIVWRLPSRAVVDKWHRMSSRIQVLENGTLIVNTVSDKDAGDYICVAQSRAGDDFQLMRVTVTMKPAKIEPKHEKKQVPFGNDVKVDCKASGAPKPDISWGLPDGTRVSSAIQSDTSRGGGRARRYTLFDNGTLYLNQVGMSEEGDYTCYAENQVGKDEMIVHISVLTAAPNIRPTKQNYAMVKPGGNMRFDCDALGEPKPKILWILPTNDVIAASNERYLIHVNGSLDIRDVKAVDAGDYICMARNLAGEKRRVYKLDIDGNPPVINGYRQNRTVVKDVAAKFSRKLIDCKAEGNPTPTITWLMPQNIFLPAPYFGGRINVHHNGTLEIRNVRPSDTAEFICMARNDGGEAVMVVQLEITSTPRRPIFKNPFNERIISVIGKTAVLNCSADGNPKPEIIWTLPNGNRLTGEADHDFHYHKGPDGSLVIYNSRKEDSGKYRCGARNFVGYIEKLVILDVGHKPYILTRPKGIIRSVAGNPLFLHCLSDGSPSPRIDWTLPGGHTLTRPQVFGRYKLLENGTLIIQATTLHDRGNYVCKARNDAGEAVLNVPVVIISYPPRITTGPPPNVKVDTGTPIQLSCAAVGIPKPEITWELPDHSVLSTAQQGRSIGSELLHPEGTLIIQRPTFSDSGTYKCVAKNRLGTDSKVTYLRVL